MNKLNENERECIVCYGKIKYNIYFELEPVWLIVDHKEQESTDDLRKIPIYLNLGQANYVLLCIYAYFPAEDGLAHFKSVFYLNSNYYIIDDLITNNITKLNENDYMQRINCIIYLRKLD
jgi:homospermidine synthase